MHLILIATHNPAKLKELSGNLKNIISRNIKLLSLKDLKINDEPEETGKDFASNSFLKAKYYAEKTGLPTIADDGGIEIDSLNGEPGVNSKRWLGFDASDQQIIDYVVKKMSQFPKNRRAAHLRTCITFYDPKTKNYFQEIEQVDGIITDKAARNFQPGFPYRALFRVDKYQKYYDELTEEEHADINHRIKALKRLEKKIIHVIPAKAGIQT